MKFYCGVALGFLCFLGACRNAEQAIPVKSGLLSMAGEPERSVDMPVTIHFAAEVNQVPFRCGQEYKGLGSTKTSVTPKDFRVYLSYFQLKNSDGKWVPLKLTEDNKWQYKDLALLDFENKSGDCQSGNPDMNTEVIGTLPVGDYQGLKFQLGVPVGLNHQDVTLASSPLSLSSLFWSWRSGYKFMRIDLQSPKIKQYSIHLGSTGCTGHGVDFSSGATSGSGLKIQHAFGDESPTSIPENCSASNRPTIQLNQFDLNQTQVVLDLGHLLAATNLDANQPDSAVGCQSAPDDLDCTAIFHRLGLFFDNKPASKQVFFTTR